ncbi:Nn.00g068490.m01.CDS01 [Neocucurbitaria sp. VM-36]
MACFAWSLLLPPFFTPATLFIYSGNDVQEITADMPCPSIANGSEAHRFSYSPPTRRGMTQFLDDVSRTFTGPRTVLSLIATATSSLGEILPVDLPYNNSAYSVQFFAPIVKCKDANTTEAQKIDEFLQAEMSTAWDTKVETDSAYFSFVPTYNSTGGLTAVWHPRQQTPSKQINQLWMTFLRPTFDDQGNRIKLRHYQLCEPHNASYNLTISQYHGFQNISGTYSVGEAIPFPNDGPNDVSNMTQHAYTAFMWVISDLVMGKLAWYNETSPTPSQQAAAQFGVIDSPIQRTSLLGSLDLDAFFEMDEEKGLYKGQNTTQIFTLSDQRLQDKAVARNRSLAVLIEELSFNTTVSLMHNRLLTHGVDTQVRLTVDVNRYSYKAYGLFIPYALANVFAFVCVVVGLVSYAHDGVLPGKKVQDIIYAARNPAVHSRPSLSRRMSMGAGIDDKGHIEIRVVQVEGVGKGKEERAGSMFQKMRWNKEKDGGWMA